MARKRQVKDGQLAAPAAAPNGAREMPAPHVAAKAQPVDLDAGRDIPPPLPPSLPDSSFAPPVPPQGAYLPYPVWLVPAHGYGQPTGAQSGLAQNPPPPQWPMMPPQGGFPAPHSPMSAAQQNLQRWLLIGVIGAVALSHLPWFAYLAAVHGCFGSFIDTCFGASDLAMVDLPSSGLDGGDLAIAEPGGTLANPDAVLDLEMLTDDALPAEAAPLDDLATNDAALLDDAALAAQPFLFARIAILILQVQNQVTADWAQFSQALQLGTGLGGFILTKLAASHTRFRQTTRNRWILVGTCALAFAVLFWAQAHLMGEQTYAVLGSLTPLGYIDANLPDGFLGAAEARAGLLQYLQTLRLADALLLGAALAMPKAEEST